MAQLAIKGHSTRGSEVIALLEMLGGENIYKLDGEKDLWYILSNSTIEYATYCFQEQCYTLDEFEARFSYKVGDKVATSLHWEGCVGTIIKMKWINDEIIYEVQWNDACKSIISYRTKALQSYKEKTLQENINESFNKTNQVIFEAQAHCCDITKSIIGKEQETMKKKHKTQEEINTYLQDVTIKNAATLCDIEIWLHNDGLELPNNVVVNKSGIGGDEFLSWYNIPKYPKTFEDCCNILNEYSTQPNITGYKYELLHNFRKLLICRDSYWKIAGDWKEKRKEKAMHYVICSTLLGEVVKDRMPNCIANYLLDFPTEEMRDAFYENFKELIEKCKELL